MTIRTNTATRKECDRCDDSWFRRQPPSCSARDLLGRARTQTSGEPKDALGELASSYMAAFNKGDCKALAAFWTPNGESVNLQGEHFEGRAALIEKFKRFFASTPR